MKAPLVATVLVLGLWLVIIFNNFALGDHDTLDWAVVEYFKNM